MAWNIVNNSESSSHENSFSGVCPKFKKNATVTVQMCGRKVCKTDLQFTYHRAGQKCSLLVGTNEEAFSPCIDDCPLVPEKF